MRVYKIIIVGAGVAGLAAAKALKEGGVEDFLIIEAQDQIGGRVATVEFGKAANDGTLPSVVELGAQWIHGEDNDFFRYLKKRDLIHMKTSWEGDGDFLTPSGKKLDGVKVRQIVDWIESLLDEIESDEDKPQNDYNSNGDVYRSLTSSPTPIQDRCRSLTNSPMVQRAGGRSYSSTPLPLEPKYSSVGEYLRLNFQEYLTQPPASQDDLSLEEKIAVFQWVMSFQRIDNSCNQMTDLSYRRWPDFEVNPGELYNNFKGGAKEMVKQLREEYLTESQIVTNSPVTQIDWTSEEIQVFVNSGNTSRVYLCHSVIITCSMGVLHSQMSSLFSPALPENIAEAIQGTGFGPVTKLYLEWDEPWWPEDARGYQLLWTEGWINCCDNVYKVDSDNGEADWVKAITGFDPVLDNSNVLLAWIGGPEAVLLESLSEDRIKADSAALLRKFTGIHVPLPSRAITSAWNTNPYVRGAYCYRSVEGDRISGDIVGILKLPVYNCDDVGLLKPALVFAGEALHKTHYSTVHGAFESGEEQARLLLELLTIWDRQRLQGASC